MAFAPDGWTEKLYERFRDLQGETLPSGQDATAPALPEPDPEEEPSILHIDMDAFFAAVEQRDNPALRGKALIIGGVVDRLAPGEARVSPRGVVTTCSYEARAFGVRSGMPLAEAWRLCPDGIFLSGSHGKYGSASLEVMDLLRRFSPELEPVSIDEAFLNVSRCHRVQGRSVDIALAIQKSVRDELGLSCSIGIGSNRLLAKMASKMRKPAGIYVLSSAAAPAVLAPMPVQKMHGIGEAATASLNRLGIHTLGELAAYPEEVLVRRFGPHMGHNLKQLSLGVGSRVVKPFGYRREEKSVGQERTFGRDQHSLPAISSELLHLCEKVGGRMRAGGWLGKVVTLRLRSSGFVTSSRQTALPAATDRDRVIFDRAMHLLQNNWHEGESLRLIGVSVSGLVQASRSQWVQGDLLSEVAPERERAVDRAIDRIRGEFGGQAIARCNAMMRYSYRNGHNG
ncbi:MAG: DNA polymerase IV [Candidatus Cloacimonetes bacterium]|nr:DNA polymerase IV [Candidatus Cloacimonadota bacterium]